MPDPHPDEISSAAEIIGGRPAAAAFFRLAVFAFAFVILVITPSAILVILHRLPDVFLYKSGVLTLTTVFTILLWSVALIWFLMAVFTVNILYFVKHREAVIHGQFRKSE